MTKVEKHAQICKSLNELYARKNADYGDSFGKSFNEYGLTMACIRLEDKLNRIKALTKQEAQVSDESIVDTLMDLANYSIMTLVELAQNEPSVTPKGVKGDHYAACDRHCQCVTCINDRSTDDTRHACCIEHGFMGCVVSNCPDYVKEDSNA